MANFGDNVALLRHIVGAQPDLAAVVAVPAAGRLLLAGAAPGTMHLERVGRVPVLSDDLDLLRHEDLGHLRAQDRPEHGGRRADAGDVDLDAAQDDDARCVPCRVEGRVGGSPVLEQTLQAEDRDQYDTNDSDVRVSDDLFDPLFIGSIYTTRCRLELTLIQSRISRTAPGVFFLLGLFGSRAVLGSGK